MLSREELAARIFCTYLANPNQGHFDYSECFRKADAFLAYAAKQREPKACEHRWATYTAINRPEDTTEYCLNCDAKKPDPPKPERVGRVFSLYKFEDGDIRAFPSTQLLINYTGFTAPVFVCRVREILPEDEHDKR